MPQPLACAVFGEMVGINHFWGGGAHRKKGRDNSAYETVALDLLQQSGIRHIRWWQVDKDIYQRYYNKGIGVFTYPFGDNLKRGSELGVRAFSGPGNEPDLTTAPVEKYVENLRAVYAKKNAICPDAVICAPSSGLEDTSIAWLDRFYARGGKDAFDVLDLHTYCKIAGGHKQPEGYPAGAPEAMFDNMRKVREVLAKYGDTAKPVISTEFGYSEAIPNNPSGKVTPLIKAQYLVRGLVIHHALGFRRVFLYSFWDEGDDANFTEHTFGLLDYDLQKKPAFFAVQTLLRTLGACELVPAAAPTPPVFHYRYCNPRSGENVSILWDGTGTKKARFRTAAQEVRRTELLGGRSTILPEADGTFAVLIGPSAMYLSAAKELEFLGAEPYADEAAGAGAFAAEPEARQVVITAPATAATFRIRADNRTGQEVSLRLVATGNNGARVLDQTRTVAAGVGQVLDCSLPIEREGPALQALRLQIIRNHDGSNAAEEFPLFVRILPEATDAPATVQQTFAGLEAPVYCLSNRQLAVSIDPARGGRVLEILERKTGTNQLRMDYALLPQLPRIPLAYGIWTDLNGKLRNDPQTVVAAKDGLLEVSAEAEGLRLIQRWALSDRTLSLAVRIINTGDAEKKLHYQLHPEYTVGGTGDSVTDVLYLPKGGRLEALPFWSGLGEKAGGTRAQDGWAVLDTRSKTALRQTISGDNWAQPRVWFGQGHYNIELDTAAELRLSGGKEWQAELTWTLQDGVTAEQLQADFTAGAAAKQAE